MTTIEAKKTEREVIDIIVAYLGQDVEVMNKLFEQFQNCSEIDVFHDTAWEVDSVSVIGNIDEDGTTIRLVVVAKADWDPAEDGQPELMEDMPVDLLLHRAFDPTDGRIDMGVNIKECLFDWRILT